MSKARIRIPSLQQVIKNLFDEARLVEKALIGNALHPPRISYKVLHRATQDRVCLDVPLSQIEVGIRAVEKRPSHLANLLSILKLLDRHFATIHPDFPPIEVECRYYRFAPDITIPFQPPLCYGIGGQLYVPYFDFWRKSPLTGKRLSVFMTILDAIRAQEPDLKHAIVPILRFAIPPNEDERKLLIVDERDIERVSQDELKRWLQTFAEGYRAAQSQLAKAAADEQSTREQSSPADPGQGDFFNPKP